MRSKEGVSAAAAAVRLGDATHRPQTDCPGGNRTRVWSLPRNQLLGSEKDPFVMGLT